MPRNNLHIDWQDIDSANIAAVALDEPTGSLCVRFVNGGLYTYMDVSADEFDNLRYSSSVGHYLHNVIKATKAYTRWANENELIEHLSL